MTSYIIDTREYTFLFFYLIAYYSNNIIKYLNKQYNLLCIGDCMNETDVINIEKRINLFSENKAQGPQSYSGESRQDNKQMLGEGNRVAGQGED